LPATVIRWIALVCLAAGPAQAEQRDMLVSTAWLHQNLGDSQIAIVEVGDLDSYIESHLRGARLLESRNLVVTHDGVPNELPSIADLEQTMRASGVPAQGRIVLYGRDPLTVTRAFFTLSYLRRGIDTAILDGGWAKWSEERRPVDHGPPTARPSSFTAIADPSVVVRFSAMRIVVAAAAAMPSRVAVVDARPSRQYFGIEAGAGITRPGHIPGALSVPWQRNMTDGAIPTFRTADELRTLYRDAGVSEDASVVTYCRTGMQASVTYFVLRYLGRDVSLYDGSYAEWSSGDDTMVDGLLVAALWHH
jgi:thiosulfate/3-mercaptopyruvate sulfurtransferase